ncbi:hypothetical protein FBEOM_13669 [Fusarium beomiforme]|uniref:Uncharacterized protein n=1 Tax=Fusarium beomiforme TaxID=44412 RepID=A0A9P5A5W0_9HYPO|nr:hypothetical protein FBEOM_13669 [Fusarium beomiforme]
MKVEHTTHRHSSIANPVTRSSNRIRAKKQTKGKKQVDSNGKKQSSTGYEPATSQGSLSSSFTSAVPSTENNFSSFTSYNSDETMELPSLASTNLLNNGSHYSAEQLGSALAKPGVPHSYPLNNPAGVDTSQLTAGQVASDVYGEKILIDSTLGKKLSNEVALRPVRQRRSDMVLNMERRSNVEAFLAHLTGVQVERSCKNCSKGHGPWSECIIYDGQMCGSCTNCWFNASGSRCTFHENNQNSIYKPAPLYNPHSAGMPSQQIQYPLMHPQAVPQAVPHMSLPFSVQSEAAATHYPPPPKLSQLTQSILQTLGIGSDE